MKINTSDTCAMDLSEEDIIKAMKDLRGYLDITPGDFREIYQFAYSHAVERLEKSVTAKDLMTRDVISVNSEMPLADVAEILNKNNITGVPVVDENRKVVGIISEKDFIFYMGVEKEKTFMGVVARCLKNTGCIAVTLRKQTAKDIMTSPVINVSEDTSLSEIADLLAQNGINRAPVTNSDNILTGIVTRTDIVRSSCSIKL